MALMASSGVSFAMSHQTLPPQADIEAAFDSIVRADRFGEADDILLMRRFLQRFPASSYVPEVTLMLGDRYFLDGLYPLAYTTYSRLDASMFAGSTKRRFLYRFGFSMVKTGYYAEARPLFRQLLTDPDYNNAARFYLAYLDYVEGNYDKAYDGFKNVSPSSERGLEAEYYINQIDFSRGEYQKVVGAAQRLLAGNVDYQLRPETMKVTGVSYYKLGQPSKALPLLEEYVEIKGDGAENSAVYTLGAILYDEGKLDRAEKLFSRLTDDQNDLAQSSWLYLGQIYAARGDDQAAALAFDRAAKQSWNPDVAETAAYNLSVSTASGSRLPFADSAAAMEQFISDHPASPYSLTLSRYLVNAYYNQHDFPKALSILESMGSSPETVALRQKVDYQYGIEKLRGGDTAAAIPLLSEAASPSAPDRDVAAQAALWLGDAYYDSGKYVEAAKAYSQAASSPKIGANAALANYDLGYARMKLKNYGEAQKAFDAALKAGGLSSQMTSDAKLRRADCLYYTGNYQQALKEFQSLGKGSGSDAVYAKIRQADILGREGKLKEKIDILKDIADSGKAGVWAPTVLQRLGDAYSENGQDSAAAAVYQQLLESSASESDKAQLYFSLAGNAEKLFAAGKKLEALEIYKNLEKSNIPEIHSQGVIGIMRTSDSPEVVVEYSDKAMRLPGVTADITDEARYLKATAQLQLKNTDRNEALNTLKEMAKTPDTEWGAEATLTLARHYLAVGQPAEAEAILQQLSDSACDDNYKLAIGYILLADAYMAQDKPHLAKEFLITLRDNYPGNEKEIYDMIDSRLKKLKK